MSPRRPPSEVARQVAYVVITLGIFALIVIGTR